MITLVIQATIAGAVLVCASVLIIPPCVDMARTVWQWWQR